MVGSVVGLGDLDGLDFGKGGGLLPAVVQDAGSRAVLTLGYMNRDAVLETLTRRRVVFFSRSRQRLWEKGETSGHTLRLSEINVDCDRDSLLVMAWPEGPACHRGSTTCFGEGVPSWGRSVAFLSELETIIEQRITVRPQNSYTARLVESGILRVAQKVGEEGLEAALAGVGGAVEEVAAESADLLYHLLVLLKVRGIPLERVIAELQARHTARP
jgi:phosphoribosyl-ATP pyrophosphohydrolase/phosphoribosyl-AMP cyclohydrolase